MMPRWSYTDMLFLFHPLIFASHAHLPFKSMVTIAFRGHVPSPSQPSVLMSLPSNRRTYFLSSTYSRSYFDYLFKCHFLLLIPKLCSFPAVTPLIWWTLFTLVTIGQYWTMAKSMSSWARSVSSNKSDEALGKILTSYITASSFIISK